MQAYPSAIKVQSDAVTERVRAFYERNPFPDYEDVDSSASLRDKAEKGIFARQLDLSIPHGAKILEAGCGTGQLSNFLGLTAGRTVFGTDICLNSLKLAQAFKKRNDIEPTSFIQMNLFRPVFKPETFDMVISNGVLHHTADPHGAYESLLGLVRKGGHILIGLYHAYGRVPTYMRSFLYKVSGDRFKFLDPELKNRIGASRREAWFKDQYKNPHESGHTFGEILSWFDHSGVKFVRSLPDCNPSTCTEGPSLFYPTNRPTSAEVLLGDLSMLFRGTSEGGFFVMIGEKAGP